MLSGKYKKDAHLCLLVHFYFVHKSGLFFFENCVIFFPQTFQNGKIFSKLIILNLRLNFILFFHQRLILSLLILTFLQFNGSSAQTHNGWSLTQLFTIVRYQNTACETEYGEQGSCVLESECNNRQGQIHTTCPTPALVCCTNKVSRILKIRNDFSLIY